MDLNFFCNNTTTPISAFYPTYKMCAHSTHKNFGEIASVAVLQREATTTTIFQVVRYKKICGDVRWWCLKKWLLCFVLFFSSQEKKSNKIVAHTLRFLCTWKLLRKERSQVSSVSRLTIIIALSTHSASYTDCLF